MGLDEIFDVYCGGKKRAPKVFLKLNLEWLYRLMREPTSFKVNKYFIIFFINIDSK